MSKVQFAMSVALMFLSGIAVAFNYERAAFALLWIVVWVFLITTKVDE